ncbi:beta-galactosidase [Sphingomonas sp. MG17]|uniref:Beta-galactosidase n=1 Tax=Sphingomonas tagetis TaxID=2949092 RepID=A0A9X2HE83_9SPHN|nr:beta-galactosidase [Sphingomonas tagetis]
MKRILSCLAAALLAGGSPAAGQTDAPPGQQQFKRLWLGSAWYPEQWPEARWEEDLRLMKAHGANVVRIGEYGWARMEPAEGQYDLDWLVRAVRLAAKYDINVVIGTPSDTPPAWMTAKYPDVVQIRSDGTPVAHGMRRHFSISSQRYRMFCREIVGRMAQALGKEPNVIGWQIGNEPIDESYDPEARAAWVAWLKQRYGTLDKLNEAWTTQYWSQAYSAWEQVPFSSDKANPGWMLEMRRFITAQWVAFHRNQLDAIRAHAAPKQFITINFGGLGWANRFDRYAANRDLDFTSWDNYVGSGHLKPFRNGATHDLVRGWKRKNFWVMEIQPGYVNWAGVSNMLHPGETRAMAWQAIGHGSDGILYWQWRNARNGQETMHGALVGQDGTPLPVYAEVAQIGREMARATPVIAGTHPVAQVALLQDYASRWAIDFQLHHKDYDQIEVLLDYYEPLKRALGAVDIVEAEGAPLAGYKLVVAPSLNVITEATAKRLADYVRGGGHLILGPRSGMKDEYNRLQMQRQPGLLAELLGGRVEQYYALLEPVAVGSGTASVWAEQLSVSAKDAEVLLSYGKANGWLDGKPAAISRKVGKGRITYIGALIDDAVMKGLIDVALAGAKVERDFALPEDVELMTREGQGRRVVILINHGTQARTVALPAAMRDVLGGGSVRSVELKEEGVAVLQR